ncbi:MAG: hypothetical protein JWP88_1243, partial [Flaviaesturariibacter sp.]|nr:hypothetical protein [Flaviaesturariibacter sp.]
TTKDHSILVFSMLPLTLLLNYILFGDRYITESLLFLATTIVTFVVLGSSFLLYSAIAIVLRNRFADESLNNRRLAISIGLFFLLSYILMTLLFRGYAVFNFFGYRYNDGDFAKGFTSMAVSNVFLTFLNEGVSRFEIYKIMSKQTEQLRKEYMQSQLLGLKSQMNPHFLFNSLNTLSSLINEDADEAELFLDEMSKVYRYLLRNTDEYLVTLETELGFIRSYCYLLQARHGEALQVSMQVPAAVKEGLLPPLTLQMIFENIINHNTISKQTPLFITIKSTGRGIVITNSIQSRINGPQEENEGLENISNKFKLIAGRDILVEASATERQIHLPLLQKEEAGVA